MEKMIFHEGKVYVINIPCNISSDLEDSLKQNLTEYGKAKIKVDELEPKVIELEAEKLVMEKYFGSHQNMRPEIKERVESEYSTLLSKLKTVRTECDATRAQKELAEAKVQMFFETCYELSNAKP